MTEVASSKRSANKLRSRSNTTSHAHKSSQSESKPALRPDFALPGAFLAQCAADALKEHPSYTAIEKETLNAVAPFTDLHKKDKVAKEHFDVHPASELPQYSLHKQEDSSSTDNSTGSMFPSKHNRNSSASSMSFEDFRKYVHTVPHLPPSIPELGNTVKSARRMTNSSIPPHSVRQSIVSDAGLLEYSRALSLREAELEDLQKRLRCCATIMRMLIASIQSRLCDSAADLDHSTRPCFHFD